MSARIAFPPVAFRAVSLSRSMLLAGVSAAALLAGTPLPAEARSPGAPSTGATGAAAAAAQASAQTAAAAAAQAMSRANASIQALRSAQAAARAAALSGANRLGQQLPEVPNGLASGGLNPTGNPNAIVDGQPAWIGADLPAQSVSANGRIQVDIVQRQPKAILTWNKFNVGRETDLYFNQAAGGGDSANWIALNRVLDPSAVPSQILGTIRAEGQVYVINQNGIIFGGASQVNVGALVASSLSLSNQQFLAGINAQLLIWNDSAAGSIAMPQFGYLGQQKPNLSISVNNPQQIPAVAIGSPPGDVTVQAGASIEIASGGKALLFAPRVSNAGRVAAPDGQVIMAAGEQVYLLTDQTGVRGLDVAVSAPMPWAFNYDSMAIATGQSAFPGNPFTNDLKNLVLPWMEQRAATVGYQVLNTGLVETAHGNITLMGREIVQNGALIASTALNNRDGSIRLRAWGQGMMSYSGELAGVPLKFWSAGTVLLAPDSVTAVVPDLTDTSPIEESAVSARYTPGRVELRGKLIDIESRANVIVPAGTISIVASTSALSGDTVIAGEPTIRDGSRFYLGEDAFVSVAGLLGVPVATESNVVAVDMRINELRDSVLYRDSWLRGVTVYVDKRKKGTFADGPMAGVNWILNSPGAWVGTPLGDASGWIGNGTTTLAELMTAGGKIAIKSSGSLITRAGSMLDVSGGSVTYQGGYVDTTKLIGADGRIYDISQATPDRVYVGIAGGFTVHHAAGITETWASPRPRTWEPGYTEGRAAGSIGMFAGEGTVLEGSYYAGVIIGERQAASGQLAKAGSLKFGEASDAARTWLLGDLIFAEDPVLLPADFKATTPLGSSWYWGTSGVSGSVDDIGSFQKRRTYIDTDVLAQSGLGSIDLYVSTGFTLGAGERLELAPGTTFAVTTNTSSSYPANPFRIDGTIRVAGGTVSLSGKFGASSVIDVSGEVVNDLTSTARGWAPTIKGGTAILNGDFAAGAMVNVSGGAWLAPNGSKTVFKVGDGGTATLGGVTSKELAGLDLRGYAAGSGASLNLRADGAIQIGGTAPSDPSVLYLPATLLAERGFRVLGLDGGDIVVPDGVTASLVPVSVAVGRTDFTTGAPITALGTLQVLSQQERLSRKPTAITVNSGGTVTIGAGARLATDIKGTINITTGTGQFNLLGALDAPAGTIAIDARLITLASSARMTAKGVDATYLNPLTRHRTGAVLGGGAISLSGVMKLTAGSVVDVSGTSGDIDVGSGLHWSPIQLFSDGGAITLTNGTWSPSFVDATLLARAGGPGAAGGSLTIADAVTSSGAKQNATAIGNFLGYFSKPASYPAGQTRYDYDPVTGQYAVNPNGLYIFVGNLATGFTDIDINNEIPASQGAIKLTSAVVTAISNLISTTTGPTRIVKGLAADAPAEAALPPSAVSSGITPEIAFLLDKYFYAAPSRTGTSPNFVYKVGAKINVDGLTPVGMTIGEASIENGGFSAVNITSPVSLKLADGVNLQLPHARLGITTPKILAPSAGASAEIHAAYMSLTGNYQTMAANSTAGTGALTLEASLIDMNYGVTRGYGQTRLVADDIRFTGLNASLNALLNVDGALVMSAGQIYPDSRTAGRSRPSQRRAGSASRRTASADCRCRQAGP
jgi:filamentous hemagglutinin